MRWILFASFLALGACTDSNGPDPDPAEICHFQSGRECSGDHVCMGVKGEECNYYTCNQDGIVGTAVACAAGTVDPVEGGPFNCDPTTITLARPGLLTPPNGGGCPLGNLFALDTSRSFPFLFCVPLAQCRPIACDPQFNDDGCPADYVCSSASQTCVPPVLAPAL